MIAKNITEGTIIPNSEYRLIYVQGVVLNTDSNTVLLKLNYGKDLEFDLDEEIKTEGNVFD